VARIDQQIVAPSAGMLENKLAAVYGLLLLYGLKADSRIKQICFQVSKLLAGHFYATRTTWNLSDNVNSFFSGTFNASCCYYVVLICVFCLYSLF